VCFNRLRIFTFNAFRRVKAKATTYTMVTVVRVKVRDRRVPRRPKARAKAKARVKAFYR
jgi:hypothetical protein